MEVETETKKFNRPTTGRPITTKISSPTNNIVIINSTKNRFFKNIEEEDSLKLIEEDINNNKEEIKSEKNNALNINILNSIGSNEHTIPYDTYNYPNYQQMELEKMIKEENELAEFLNQQKKKIKEIDLIEKNIDGLYNWSSLFSKSKSIKSYTMTNQKYDYYRYEEEKNQSVHLNLVTSVTGNDHKLATVENFNDATNLKYLKNEKTFKFPVALIDEKEEVINEFIDNQKNCNIKKKKRNKNDKNNSKEKRNKNDKSVNKKSNNTNNSFSATTISNFKIRKLKNTKFRSNAARPQSVYANRNDNDVYYLDKAFSQYFTQDESEFVSKFPLLHPKIRCKSKNLKKTLNEVKTASNKHDQILTNKKNSVEDDLTINQKDLNLAGNSKNTAPLLKSIYKQIYPDISEEPLPSNKIYPNSNKPLGEKNQEIDYFRNVRNKNMQRLNSGNSGRERIKSARAMPIRNFVLNLETYEENDPELKIFEQIQEKIVEHPDDYNDEEINASYNNNEFKKDEVNVNEHLLTIEKVPEFLESNNSLEDNDILNELQNFKITAKKNHFSRPKTAIINKNNTMQNFRKNKPLTAGNRPKAEFSVGVGTDVNRNQEMMSFLYETKKLQIDYANYNKTLPYKVKANKHPYAYQKMKETLKISQESGAVKFLFDDAVKIENINDEFKKLNDNFNSGTPRIMPERPKTSNDALGNKKQIVSKIIEKGTKIGKFIILLNFYILGDILTVVPQRILSNNYNKFNSNLKKNNINNIYFNDYIDMQFKPQMTNFMRKDEMPYLIKKQNLNKNSKLDKESFSDLIVISNFNFNDNNNTNKLRNIKSAKIIKNKI